MEGNQGLSRVENPSVVRPVPQRQLLDGETEFGSATATCAAGTEVVLWPPWTVSRLRRACLYADIARALSETGGVGDSTSATALDVTLAELERSLAITILPA